MQRPALLDLMTQVAKGTPPLLADDDDCEICRMLASEPGVGPVEIITLGDGSIVEVRSVPAHLVERIGGATTRS